MDDGAHVRLVDAHAERNRSHDDLNLAALEFEVNALSDAPFKSGMVGGGPAPQQPRQLLRRLLRRRVHNRRPVLLFCKQRGYKYITLRLRHLQHFDVQVVAAEAMDE